MVITLEESERIAAVTATRPPDRYNSAQIAYSRNMDLAQVHAPRRPGEDRIAWNGSPVRVVKIESGEGGREFARLDTGLVVQVEPKVARYINCKSCHWDFWFDPALPRTERPYTVGYCEWCHGVADRPRYREVPTWRDRLAAEWGEEVSAIRAFLATLGMLGLMGLGGFVLVWLLGVLFDLAGV